MFRQYCVTSGNDFDFKQNTQLSTSIQSTVSNNVGFILFVFIELLNLCNVSLRQCKFMLLDIIVTGLNL